MREVIGSVTFPQLSVCLLVGRTVRWPVLISLKDLKLHYFNASIGALVMITLDRLGTAETGCWRPP